MTQEGSRRAAIAAIGILLAAAVIVGVRMALDPLRRSETTIQARLLQEAPIGSSMEHVQRMIGRHQWGLAYVSTSTGFYDQRARPARETGAKSIRASLGDYYDFPWMANVTVFWGFDHNGKLIDLWVWKTWDAL